LFAESLAWSGVGASCIQAATAETQGPLTRSFDHGLLQDRSCPNGFAKHVPSALRAKDIGVAWSSLRAAQREPCRHERASIGDDMCVFVAGGRRPAEVLAELRASVYERGLVVYEGGPVVYDRRDAVYDEAFWFLSAVISFMSGSFLKNSFTSSGLWFTSWVCPRYSVNKLVRVV
jgi:hypothetical protein